MRPAPFRLITKTVNRGEVGIPARPVYLRQTKNRCRQLRLPESLAFYKDFFVVQFIRRFRRRAVWVKRAAERRIFVEQTLFYWPRLHASEAAIGSIDIAAAQKHQALGAAGKGMHSGTSVGFAHWDHMNHDFKRKAQQVLREAQHWHRGLRTSEVPDSGQEIGLVLAAVKQHHVVATIVEFPGHVRSDEAGAADDEDAHRARLAHSPGRGHAYSSQTPLLAALVTTSITSSWRRLPLLLRVSSTRTRRAAILTG